MNFVERFKFGKFLKRITISKIDTLTGYEFEEFVANLFEYLGFKTSLTSQSGDNGIDVIAKSHRYSIGIQTKLYYNHNVNNKAIQEVYSGKSYYHLDYAMAITNWTFSPPAINLAKSLNVITINRHTLTKMLASGRKENMKLINTMIMEIHNETN